MSAMVFLGMGYSRVGRILTPLRGWILTVIFPRACARGYCLTPLPGLLKRWAVPTLRAERCYEGDGGCQERVI